MHPDERELSEGIPSWPQSAHSESKGQCYSKLSPKVKAEISRQAAEHGVAATVRLHAKKLPSCWAIGVVNLKLEVG